jgi:hypothetical protein
VYDICRQVISTRRSFLDLLAENDEIASLWNATSWHGWSIP